MSYEISLSNLLENADKDLHGRLAKIRSDAQSLLSYTQGKFPFYTPHDFSHSINVEENLNWIVPDQLKEEINTYELFFLIVAAWLHDWGMVGEEGEAPEDVRENHHVRTEEYFEKMHDKLYLNEHEARIIGRICKGHRKVDLNGKEYDDIVFSQNIKIRTRFLAALLRFADECDITHNRTPEIIYCSLNPSGQSEVEFKKHLSIGGIGQLDEKHKIYISAIAKDPKGARTLREVAQKIQNELDGVKGIFAQNGIILDLIELRLETRGFIDKPIGFEVDKKNIVNLLIGEHLYSNQDVAIRELVQNSIDSCKLKENIDPGFHCKTVLQKDSCGNLVITDNGIGMSYSEAKKFLSIIGSSFYKSQLYQKKFGDKSYSPISQFGIGILSSFLISNKITIETFMHGHEACKFYVESVNDDWKYEKGSLKEPGTKIVLALNEIGKALKIEDSLTRYFLCPEVEIEYKDCDLELKTFESGWTHDLISKRFLNDQSDLYYRQDFIFTEILNERRDDYDYIVTTDNGWHQQQLILFIHGIYIGKFEIEGLSRRCRIYVNLKRNLVDLHISRENVKMNKKWSVFISSLFHSIFSMLDKKNKDLDYYKNISTFSSMLARHIVLVDTPKNSLIKEVPFLKSFCDCVPVLLVSGKSVNITDFEYILNSNELLIYNCSIGSLSAEMELLSTFSKETPVIVNNYDLSIGMSGDRISPKLMQYIRNERGIKFKELDLREILISISKEIVIDYPEILPENVRLVTFEKNINPLVIIYRHPKVKKHAQALGENYWGNILLWKELLDEDRQCFYLDSIRKYSDDRLDRIKIIEKPVVYVSASDDFIKSVFEKRKEGQFDNEISKNVQRYFKYLSFLPLAINNSASCLIFLEVLDKLEAEIGASLEIEQPLPMFQRMKPNSKIYLEYFRDFGPNFNMLDVSE